MPALADPALRPRDADIPPDACLHGLFAAQAARTPDAEAVVCAGESLTYAELVVALLGALKAGGVCVPLDPVLPAERLAYLAEDARARALDTREALAGRSRGRSRRGRWSTPVWGRRW